MHSPKITLREEIEADHAAIHAVNAAAFESAAEAELVARLRAAEAVFLSLVAVSADAIVGHCLFSPVTVAGAAEECRWVALGPMAVLPAEQRKGIGSALVGAGLEACRERGAPGVFVLGHPAFYPRFGFRPSASFGIRSEYDVPDEVFMVEAFEPDALAAASGGTVQYHAAFQGV